MTANEAFFDRWDSIDVTDFRNVVKSEPFAAVMRRMEAERERYVEICLRSGDTVALMRAQGSVRAIDVALATPARMLEEIAEYQKGKPKT